MTTYETRTVSVSIDRPFAAVYDFLAKPENFSSWAAGLGELTGREGDSWTAKTPDGEARVRFTEPNPYGVVDHHVSLDNGLEIDVVMRAIPNGDGAEVLFTLVRRPEVTDEEFAADAEWVFRDLRALKDLLEAATTA